MKEANLLRLAKVFIIFSRVVYVVPYLKPGVAERKKIDIIIRKGIKVALGLPQNASRNRLMQLGVSNALEEFVEAPLTAQHHRLLGTKTGRKVLERLG